MGILIILIIATVLLFYFSLFHSHDYLFPVAFTTLILLICLIFAVASIKAESNLSYHKELYTRQLILDSYTNNPTQANLLKVHKYNSELQLKQSKASNFFINLFHPHTVLQVPLIPEEVQEDV